MTSLIETTTQPEAEPAPEWTVQPPLAAQTEASTIYRGLRLLVRRTGFTVTGRCAGYVAVAVVNDFSSSPPTIEEWQHRAIAAAAELLAAGWRPA